MFCTLTKRFITETDRRALWKFFWNFGIQGALSVRSFNRRVKRGDFSPAFLFISVTDRCNMQCKGCWVTSCEPCREFSEEQLSDIISESRKKGVRFFGILGGEPMIIENKLFNVLGKFPDCYFLLFTNGTLLNSDNVARMRELGNISPLISLEGNEIVSDTRRKSNNVFQRTMNGIQLSVNEKLVTGVATSVCKNNMKDLVNEDFIDRLIDEGVKYIWYYIYRPVGPDPSPELVLSEDEVRRLREFIVDVRVKKPVLIVDSYWDHMGRALCPAATGIAVHINPDLWVEPCPPIQFSDIRFDTAADPGHTVNRSVFLKNFREKITERTRGCIIMEDPELLLQVVRDSDAQDTTGRDGFKEMGSVTSCCSHKTAEIPEKSFLYRFAKKYWFFGFGAYG